jgi:hypothetical protein
MPKRFFLSMLRFGVVVFFGFLASGIFLFPPHILLTIFAGK